MKIISNRLINIAPDDYNWCVFDLYGAVGVYDDEADFLDGGLQNVIDTLISSYPRLDEDTVRDQIYDAIDDQIRFPSDGEFELRCMITLKVVTTDVAADNTRRYYTEASQYISNIELTDVNIQRI